MKKVAIYGKGGIGKSTTAVNTAIMLARSGLRVALVGCDPKQDTVRLLADGYLPSILDNYEGLASGEVPLETCVAERRHGILCAEVGGPKPGVGCAGRGIVLALELLKQRGVLRGRDVVLYDVLGDVVCGGFATPVVRGYAEEVYIVTSGEQASLYAANNIAKGMNEIGRAVRGLIFNASDFPGEEAVVRAFAARTNLPLTAAISRSLRTPAFELQGLAVTDADGTGPEAAAYAALAAAVMAAAGEPPAGRPCERREFFQMMQEVRAACPNRQG